MRHVRHRFSGIPPTLFDSIRAHNQYTALHGHGSWGHASGAALRYQRKLFNRKCLEAKELPCPAWQT